MKRVFDILVSLCALVALSPVFASVYFLVMVKLGTPVLFRQMRPGKDGVPFMMLKFRSMRDGDGSDVERITPLGAKLRSTSLDELPGLWNVLKGEMSLVGPRPLLMEYLPLYSHSQARRHEVQPGITGWAQVNGRNALSWDEKFALDIWYIDNRTFALDCKIIWITIRKVIIRDGISAEGDVTMPKFTGSEK